MPKRAVAPSSLLLHLGMHDGSCVAQVDQNEPVRAAAAAEALSALLVLLAPAGCAPHDAPPPPGDLLTEARLAGAVPYCLAC